MATTEGCPWDSTRLARLGASWLVLALRTHRAVTAFTIDVMTEEKKDKAKAAAARVGGVCTAGAASAGVLELAAQGAATGLSAGLAIGAGAAGALPSLARCNVYRNKK